MWTDRWKWPTLIPSKVSSSFFTRILTGFLMNFFVTSSTSSGMVAESRTTCNSVCDPVIMWLSAEACDIICKRAGDHTCVSLGINLNTLYIWSLKPRESISSASSSTNILMLDGSRDFLWIISWTLPGVPTTTCTPFCRVPMSCLTLVPPMHPWQLTFM